MENSSIPAPPPFVQFLEFHKPTLDLGEYEITVSQEVASSKIPQTEVRTFSRSAKFHVFGEQFSLHPSDFAMLFPGENSRGEHGNVLPHLILDRSTLPWERSAVPGGVVTWLALLVFHQGEEEDLQQNNVSLRDLRPALTGPTKWPGIAPGPNQKDDDLISVIDIKWQLLADILPTTKDLAFLAHVRQGLDKNQVAVGDEKAVIVANRLPFSGGMTTVHLVSLENRYDQDGFIKTGLKNTDLVRLVSLKSWQFYCESKNSYKITDQVLDKFRQIKFYVNDLDKFADLKEIELIGSAEFLAEVKNKTKINFKADDQLVLLKYAVFHKQTFKGLLEHLHRGVLRMPAVGDAEAESYLSNGFVPLPHHFRVGQQSISWYRGPLLPGENPTPALPIPVRVSDELVRYQPDLGMFDVSYAAAWELGRLLLLSSKRTAISLYQWKRTHYQQLRQGEQFLQHPHLVASGRRQPNTLDIPNQIATWFNDLSLLKGIPFNYLVPEEQLLPVESIRFFQLDPLWVHYLLDGAFSLGRVAGHDHTTDAANPAAPKVDPTQTITGVLLRSEVVAAWPDLSIDAYRSKALGTENLPDAEQLTLLRRDRLSQNVIICLFAGVIQTLDVHQKPESLHFGLDITDQDGTFYKQLKNKDGAEIAAVVKDIPWKNKKLQVVNIGENKGLVGEILQHQDQTGFTTITAAEFGLCMLEGVQRVRFISG